MGQTSRLWGLHGWEAPELGGGGRYKKCFRKRLPRLWGAGQLCWIKAPAIQFIIFFKQVMANTIDQKFLTPAFDIIQSKTVSYNIHLSVQAQSLNAAILEAMNIIGKNIAQLSKPIYATGSQ